ncbi:MAG TPA: DUF1800 domain-containing protein [Vicinamibacterales bacterium]|nr:DUF1800 domain-containing protein [Vicinamibacterales bacterium]
MARRELLIEHLLRRIGFGASPGEVEYYADLGYATALDRLINYESIYDGVDDVIGKPGYVGMTVFGGFAPATNISHARQRWVFRMVHTERPLQEKMALFWHNHFATAYSKVSGNIGAIDGTRAMAAKASETPARLDGQLELFRKYATGNFRELLLAVAKDVAMLVWLDGRTNFKRLPQENFARELMELFTMGVGNYIEADVYAGARVFTGWNLTRVGGGAFDGYYRFFYDGRNHETSAKTFTFPIYPDGRKTIPARSEADGIQDGVDLIDAVVRHPATGPRLARKLYGYFVNEADPPDEKLIADMASDFYRSGYEIKPMLIRLFVSPQFTSRSNYFKRYSWPAEFVVRSIKETGWTGFSVNDALNPLISMGQQLFEPPDVAGWDLGQLWFTSGAMLARMNFAAQIASNQKFELRNAARGQVNSPEGLVSWALDRMTTATFPSDSYNALIDYARAGGAWTGSETQLATKASGLAHLIVGSGEYQLV